MGGRKAKCMAVAAKTEVRGFEGWAAEQEVECVDMGTQEYRVTATVTMNGAPKVGLREWYFHRASGEMRPGKAGFSLPANVVEELVGPLLEACGVSKELAAQVKADVKGRKAKA